ncbi:MAG: hypothetical protein RG741_05755 [Bacteroidales bacterium]|nr:hypothetical protein [Bacteroidales bacterium]
MALYKIIGTFILIYLIFRILVFYVMPRIGQWYLNRHRDRFYRNNPSAAKAKERMEKQGMRIAQDQKHQTTDTDNIGEYVDFEDVEDDDK